MSCKTDLHIHTVVSGDAFGTVAEVVETAREKGLHLVAITDHGPSMPRGPHPYYFGNMVVLPRERCGVRILRGVEASITNERGELDLAQRYLESLDLVLVGFHEFAWPGGTVEDNTRTLILAMSNPRVRIVAHPNTREYPIDVGRVIRAARDFRVALELNNRAISRSLEYRQKCLEIARLAGQYGVPLVASSDAHTSYDVGEVKNSITLAREAGLSEQELLNWNQGGLIEFLALAG